MECVCACVCAYLLVWGQGRGDMELTGCRTVEMLVRRESTEGEDRVGKARGGRTAG